MLPEFNHRTLGLHALVLDPDPLSAWARLGTVGHERRSDPGYDWHGLRRADGEFALFQYTLRGSGRLRVGAEEKAVAPGEAMLLEVPSDHRYWLPAGGVWEFIFVCLHGAHVRQLWSELTRRHGPVLALDPASEPVRCAARSVAGARQGEIDRASTSAALALELVARLLAHRPSPSKRDAAQTRALAHAREFAETRLAAPLGVADLARAAGLSRFHFSRLFAVETGQTPAAWLAGRRVRAAAQLLVAGDLPLKIIAERCGFSDVHTFGKVFRRHTGRTPGRFRRSGG